MRTGMPWHSAVTQQEHINIWGRVAELVYRVVLPPRRAPTMLASSSTAPRIDPALTLRSRKAQPVWCSVLAPAERVQSDPQLLVVHRRHAVRATHALPEQRTPPRTGLEIPPWQDTQRNKQV